MSKISIFLLRALGSLATIVLLAIPAYLFFRLYSEIHFNPNDKLPIFSFGDFLNVAMWVQALVAWFTLIFIAFASWFAYRQVVFLRRQTMLAHQRAEREAYLPLISLEMQSTKRFLSSSEIRKELNHLNTQLNAVPTPDLQRYGQILDETRNRFREIGEHISLPLLHGNKASLDHVEALINRYNDLAKLIEDGKLEEKFATDQALANFKNVYELVLPLIELRRKISPPKYEKYANHFSRYYETH